jgi:hypothetical protein
MQPVHAVRAGEGSNGPASTGAHDQNLQVGWLKSSPSTAVTASKLSADSSNGDHHGSNSVTPPPEASVWQPVFLDCWHRPEVSTGGPKIMETPSSSVSLSVAYVVEGNGARVAVGAPFDSAAVSINSDGSSAVPLVKRVQASLLSLELRKSWVAVEDIAAWARDGNAPPAGTHALEVHELQKN